MTARNRVVREPYATWCGRTPVEIIHGLLPDSRSATPLALPQRPVTVPLAFEYGSEITPSRPADCAEKKAMSA